MDLRSGRASGGLVCKVALLFCACLCFFSVCALVSGTGSGRASVEIRNRGMDSCKQGGCRRRDVEGVAAVPRRILGGPGSYPPRCTSKCGKCTPCRPVHVPVPPGTPVTTEYYPEAWRCKCGDRLYMP
ncbi:EPIDERMAL PATTERNING FACTOR-like protein 6 isoform X2 [Phoenix dactylifera]|uniref:Epidermal patterning factor-like protein n=1 Tax=Phoenix dactylifera TaxID=42345 RepID=A0A8B7BPF1_PHODC|nr:EPIDERMAL PATTERNING FACTOR-like protein 6 isoform X2 [Phoenix dactylifera]